MAAALSEPKLIPETLTTELGRNAWARPRAPPSTLAHGSGTGVGFEGLGRRGGQREGDVLDDQVVVRRSRSLSVPKPKVESISFDDV